MLLFKDIVYRTLIMLSHIFINRTWDHSRNNVDQSGLCPTHTKIQWYLMLCVTLTRFKTKGMVHICKWSFCYLDLDLQWGQGQNDHAIDWHNYAIDWHKVCANMKSCFGWVNHTNTQRACTTISVFVTLTWINNLQLKIQIKYIYTSTMLLCQAICEAVVHTKPPFFGIDAKRCMDINHMAPCSGHSPHSGQSQSLLINLLILHTGRVRYSHNHVTMCTD